MRAICNAFPGTDRLPGLHGARSKRHVSPFVPEAYRDARRAEILFAAHACFARNGFRDTRGRPTRIQSGTASPRSVYRPLDEVIALSDIGAIEI